MDMSQSDPVTEWSSSGGQTGLEEPMWQLGLGGGSESYPERPDEADCIHYLRTGFCRYGARCRFNHPRDRGLVVGAMRASGGEYPERMGQPVCQYYMRTGMCKFGASCKYHHPRQGVGSSSTVTLNMSGYPLRPGENECSYYVKTGQCKFGITCKFHHPQPSGMIPSAPLSSTPSAIYPTMQSPSASSSQQYGILAGNWPVARPPLLHSGTYGPVLIPPGMVQFPGWNPYQAPVNPVASPNAQTTFGAGPVYAITQLSPSAPSYTGPYLSMPSSTGPLGSSQKEHAYPEWTVPKTNFMLSPMGLPLRPGAPLCTHYAQNGVCRFGPSCKFDHPMGTLSYSPSASSLVDMPVAPYPVGSSIGTLAPSLSSSELRPELISSSNKDGLSSSMPSGSVGLSFSKPGSSSTSHGGDAHSSN